MTNDKDPIQLAIDDLNDYRTRFKNGYDEKEISKRIDCLLSALQSQSIDRELPAEKHGDLICNECRCENPTWFSDHKTWNFVMGGPEARDDPGGILCPNCFIKKAAEAGIKPTVWKLVQEPFPAVHGTGELTYAEFLDANKRRQKDWPSENWSLAEWMTALTGEVGEAANIIKKVFRGNMTLDAARKELGKELADINTYLTIFADKVGVDLAEVSVEKFNEVSRRPDVNSDVFINVRSKDTLRGECPNRGKPCSCTNENNCVTQEPPQINAHKLNIHILLDVLSCAAKGEPIDPEQCEVVAGIAKEYSATDFTEEDIQALYDCGPKPLPADKQAALDDFKFLETYLHQIGSWEIVSDKIMSIKAALTAQQPVADLEGLKDEASKKLKNFSAEHLFGVYEFLDHLHATGRLTTSADVQELKDAVRDYEDRLTLDQGIFAHYADLHSTKGTEDGKAKCAANLQHANSIALVREKHAPTIAKVKGK